MDSPNCQSCVMHLAEIAKLTSELIRCNNERREAMVTLINGLDEEDQAQTDLNQAQEEILRLTTENNNHAKMFVDAKAAYDCQVKARQRAEEDRDFAVEALRGALIKLGEDLPPLRNGERSSTGDRNGAHRGPL